MSNHLRVKMPTYDQLMNPLIKALKELGGSGTIDEMYEKVIEILDLPDHILDIPHSEKGGNQSEVAYRLAWSRTYLKKYGVLENSSRGVWALAKDSIHIDEVDEKEVVRVVREQSLEKSNEENINHTDDELENDGIEKPEEIESWRASYIIYYFRWIQELLSD